MSCAVLSLPGLSSTAHYLLSDLVNLTLSIIMCCVVKHELGVRLISLGT